MFDSDGLKFKKEHINNGSNISSKFEECFNDAEKIASYTQEVS